MSTSRFDTRREALGLLARSPAELLDRHFRSLSELPPHSWLRRPETGMVMLNGRIGGKGEAFKLGEATMTRCTLRLADGTIGVGTVRGRKPRQAEQIALCDALLQRSESAQAVQNLVLAPLAEDEARRNSTRAGEIALSQVDFFTLVRGED